jgi:amino acid adenylation domain-containing protein/non-ribosomal peptide synthase protein (TIGR01720 family)
VSLYPAHWNQSVLLNCQQPIPQAHLRAALNTLVDRHSSLRIQATATGLVVREAVSADVLQAVPVTDEQAFAALCEDAQRSLDPAAGRLVQALYAPYLASGPTLLLVIHHLAVDGMSWRVLIDELHQQCVQLAAGQPLSLTAPGQDAQAWAGRWQQALAAGALPGALTAWQAHTQGLQPWPLAGLAGTDESALGGTGRWHSHVARHRTDALLSLTGTHRRLHIDDLLLTAFAQALAQVDGVAHACVWVDREGHGRDPLPGDDSDLSTSVGWFTSVYPVAVHAGPDLRQALGMNRQQRLATPDHGVSYGLLRELGTAEQQALLRQIPQPNLRFNYLGVLDAGFAQQALFTLGDGPRGAERDPQAPATHALSLDAHVQGGQLHLAWHFDRRHCSAPRVQAVAQAFEQAVEHLITLCAPTDFATLAPLDFPLAGLAPSQLAALDMAPARLEALYAPEQGRYLNQLALTLHRLDVPRFIAAWSATVARHPVLRTAIVSGRTGETPLQWVDRGARLAIERHDLSTAQAPGARLEELARQQRLTPFDLSRPPLMRAALVQLPDDSYRFLWTRHHLLLDGWSSAAVLAEVLQRYREPDAPALGATVPRYRDYIGWLLGQPGVLEGNIDAQTQAFWHPRATAAAEPTLLAAALPPPSTPPPASADHHAVIDTQWSATDTTRLEGFARGHRLTLNTLLQGALLLVLHRCTGQPTVMLGTTVAGRPAALADAQQMVGLFINTLPLVSSPSPMLEPVPWLQSLQAENLALREHEHVPLATIQRLRPGGGPLFDTLLVFENYPLDAAPAGAVVDPRALDYSDVAVAETTGYPLTCVATLQPALHLRLAFDTRLFDTFRVERLASHVRHVLGALIDQGTGCLGDISLLDRASQARFEHNSQGPTLAGRPECVAFRVARQALHTPAATAVRCAGTALDYATLLQRSHGLAQQLREQGIGPEDRVAIALARGLDLPVAMLAVWQAGAAYVPIDPEYPLDRIAYVLEDAGVRAIIADAEGHARLPDLPGVARVTPDTLRTDAPGFVPATLHPEQAAYVIYTSGSTGRPKGVVITQGALGNFIEAMRQSPGLRPHERLLAVTSLSFDIAVLELMLPLVVGGEVVIARHLEARDPAFLRAALDAASPASASVMQATPATWRLLLDAGWQPRPGMRMFCGGEALPADLAKALLHPDAELWNLYGPTEATVWASTAPITQVAPVNQTIGRAVGNTTLYVLDDALQPLPTGVAGELYIGGAGLARGYHRRPGLSAERFVPDPFAARHTPGARMYRSGDLVRWRSDGTLEYLSRLDQQVKVRGFRIELGEIEAVLCEHPQVRQAAVVAREGAGGLRLLAYACALPDVQLDIPALRTLLASRLPAYMHPAHLQQLNEMPLTPNGKLDRRALPEPAAELTAPTPPMTPFEQKMAALWTPLLGTGQVGPDDDFFALGGHSLLATRLIGQVAQAFAVEVALRALFEAPTLRGFSAQVEALGTASADLKAMDALLDEFAMD